MRRPTSPRQLELDLEAAKTHGRWLSDEESEALEHERLQELQLQQTKDHLRLRLFIFTGICLLIPPLWPVALGLSFYLLFPKTLSRIGLVLGLILVVASIGLAVSLTALTIWILSLLF